MTSTPTSCRRITCLIARPDRTGRDSVDNDQKKQSQVCEDRSRTRRALRDHFRANSDPARRALRGHHPAPRRAEGLHLPLARRGVEGPFGRNRSRWPGQDRRRDLNRAAGDDAQVHFPVAQRPCEDLLQSILHRDGHDDAGFSESSSSSSASATKAQRRKSKNSTRPSLTRRSIARASKMPKRSRSPTTLTSA